MKGPILYLFAVLASLQTITAGTGLAGVIGYKYAGLASLMVSGLQSGLIAYSGLVGRNSQTVSETITNPNGGNTT